MADVKDLYNKEDILEQLRSCLQEAKTAEVNVKKGSEEYDQFVKSLKKAMEQIGNIDEENKKIRDLYENVPKAVENSLIVSKNATIESALKRIRETATMYLDKKYRENSEYAQNSKPGKRIAAAGKAYDFAIDVLKANPENNVKPYEKLNKDKVDEWYEDFKQILTNEGIDLNNPVSLFNVSVRPDKTMNELKKIDYSVEDDYTVELNFKSFNDAFKELGEKERPAFFKNRYKEFTGYSMQKGDIYKNITEKIKLPDKISRDEVDHLYRLYREGRLFIHNFGNSSEKTLLPDKEGKCILMPPFDKMVNEYSAEGEVFGEAILDADKVSNLFNLTKEQVLDYNNSCLKAVSADGIMDGISIAFDKFCKKPENKSDIYLRQHKTLRCYRKILNIARYNSDWTDTKEKTDTLLSAYKASLIPEAKRSKKQSKMVEYHKEIEIAFINIESEMLKETGYSSLKALMENAKLSKKAGGKALNTAAENTYEFMMRLYKRIVYDAKYFMIDGKVGYFDNHDFNVCAPEEAQKLISTSIINHMEFNKKLPPDKFDDKGMYVGFKGLDLNDLLMLSQMTLSHGDNYKQFGTAEDRLRDYSGLLQKCTGARGTSEKYQNVETCLANYLKDASKLGPGEKAKYLERIGKYADAYINGKTENDLRNSYTAKRVKAMKKLNKEVKKYARLFKTYDGLVKIKMMENRKAAPAWRL